MAKTTSQRGKKTAMPKTVKPRTGSRIKTKSPSRSSRSNTARKNSQQKAVRRSVLEKLSPERKLDIVGVVLAFVGLLTLLSLLSTNRGTVTGLWVNVLKQITGWGTYILPLGLIGLGLWLVFRNIERLPHLSMGRILGIVLLFFNLLTWMHLLGGGGWELAKAGAGGGYAGGIFEQALVVGIGRPGAVTALIAWLIISTALVLDQSILELLQNFSPFFEKIRSYFEGSPSKSPRTASSISNQAIENDTEESTAVPPNFQPLMLNEKEETPSHSRQKPKKSNNEKEILPAAQTSEKAQNSSSASAVTASGKNWVLPAVNEMLDPATPVLIQENIDQERAALIEETLSSFGAPGHVVSIQRGPTITQYGIEPDYVETRNGKTRVRVSKIANLADDLALAMAATRIRIQAPVPGHSYVGIEVPNSEISQVSLLEVITSSNFKKINSPLRFSLGKDVAGKPVSIDLAKMPHILIAGTTGSGKSVCINSILCCFLMNNTPKDLRLVLVDPKRVELTGYNGIPHLLSPVIVETDRVIGALQWMLREMDSRYHKFAKLGVRNIQEYNKRQSEEHLPYIVVVIDELADLMMLAPDETERAITRLAQLARATGIHLILATQRPSVNVVTGLIKANFPARVAFAVASGIDSRVILDQPGAERLLGRGDMLFQAPDAPAPARLQGVYVSDIEIRRLVDFWKTAAVEAAQNGTSSPAEPSIDQSLPPGIPLHQAPLFDEMEPEEKGDPLLNEAIELVRTEGRASITMLQRRMRIGYTRSARIIDAMEEKGIISGVLPNTQVREVLDYGDMAPPADD